MTILNWRRVRSGGMCGHVKRILVKSKLPSDWDGIFGKTDNKQKTAKNRLHHGLKGFMLCKSIPMGGYKCYGALNELRMTTPSKLGEDHFVLRQPSDWRNVFPIITVICYGKLKTKLNLRSFLIPETNTVITVFVSNILVVTIQFKC